MMKTMIIAVALVATMDSVAVSRPPATATEIGYSAGIWWTYQETCGDPTEKWWGDQLTANEITRPDFDLFDAGQQLGQAGAQKAIEASGRDKWCSDMANHKRRGNLMPGVD